MNRLNAAAQTAADAQNAPVAEGRTCLECGGALEGIRARADFCGTPCRRTFNNRRQLRGAELYDLVMALRFERAEATELKVWQAINRLAAAYRQEDIERRGGRRSWRSARAVIRRMPWIRNRVVDAPKR